MQWESRQLKRHALAGKAVGLNHRAAMNLVRYVRFSAR